MKRPSFFEGLINHFQIMIAAQGCEGEANTINDVADLFGISAGLVRLAWKRSGGLESPGRFVGSALVTTGSRSWSSHGHPATGIVNSTEGVSYEI